MKNYSIPTKYKDEAIPLLEKLGYKEDTEWNEISKSQDKTHILTHDDGTWGFYNHKGDRKTPITIEELRELAGETAPEPDKLDIIIKEVRELRAELREFMWFIQTEANEPKPKPEWKICDKVRINGSMHSTHPIECHRFETGEIVELIDYVNEIVYIPWNAKSESGEKWWISESEAELITE